MVRLTSARPSGARPAAPSRPDVPAKMTSSIFPPLNDFAPCSPITQARASTTLDLPEPLGPTMQVMPGSSWRVVADANDLKPRSVRLFRYTGAPSESEPPLPPVGGQETTTWRQTAAGRTAGAPSQRAVVGKVSGRHPTVRGSPNRGARLVSRRS